MKFGCFSKEQLREIGLRAIGDDVSIDSSCRFYQPEKIAIGSHVRIDANCILSAGVGELVLGNRIHLAVGVFITGAASVTLEDFVGLSAGVSVFSSNDDYVSGHMTGPMAPLKFRKISSGPVLFRQHAIVGAGTVVLPNVTIGVGAAVGALTLVKESVPDFAIVGGNPMRRIGTRDSQMAQYEKHITG